MLSDMPCNASMNHPKDTFKFVLKSNVPKGLVLDFYYICCDEQGPVNDSTALHEHQNGCNGQERFKKQKGADIGEFECELQAIMGQFSADVCRIFLFCSIRSEKFSFRDVKEVHVRIEYTSACGSLHEFKGCSEKPLLGSSFFQTRKSHTDHDSTAGDDLSDEGVLVWEQDSRNEDSGKKVNRRSQKVSNVKRPPALQRSPKVTPQSLLQSHPIPISTVVGTCIVLTQPRELAAAETNTLAVGYVQRVENNNWKVVLFSERHPEKSRSQILSTFYSPNTNET